MTKLTERLLVVGKNPDGSYKTLRGKIKKEQIKPEYFEKLNRFNHE